MPPVAVADLVFAIILFQISNSVVNPLARVRLVIGACTVVDRSVSTLSLESPKFIDSAVRNDRCKEESARTDLLAHEPVPSAVRDHSCRQRAMAMMQTIAKRWSTEKNKKK